MTRVVAGGVPGDGCEDTWSRYHCRNGREVKIWPVGWQGMAVQRPGEGITTRIDGRSRHGKSGGREWAVQIPGEGITTTLHEWQGAPNMSRGVAKEEAEDGCALCRYLEQGSLQKWLGGWPVGWQEGGCADT